MGFRLYTSDLYRTYWYASTVIAAAVVHAVGCEANSYRELTNATVLLVSVTTDLSNVATADTIACAINRNEGFLCTDVLCVRQC